MREILVRSGERLIPIYKFTKNKGYNKLNNEIKVMVTSYSKKILKEY